MSKSDKGWTILPDDKITDVLIQFAREHRKNGREIIFGEATVDEGFKCGFFTNFSTYETEDQPAPIAEGEDLYNIKRWEKELQSVTKRMAAESGTLQIEQMTEIEESIMNIINARPSSTTSTSLTSYNAASLSSTDVPSSRPLLAMLNSGQRRAHNIIEERLQQHLEGKHAP